MFGGNAGHVLIYSSDKKKILLTQRSDIPMWVMPGGHVQKGETFERAAIREVKEETGFVIIITKQLAIFSDKKKNIEKHLFLGEVESGKIRTSKETVKVEWFDQNKLPMFMTQYERDRIELIHKFQGKIFHKPLYFNKKKELIFQLKNPIRFSVFLYSYIRNSTS